MGSSSGGAKETPVTSDARHIELSTIIDANLQPKGTSDLDIAGAEITEVITSHGVEKYSEDDDAAMEAMANFDGQHWSWMRRRAESFFER
jgi:hypothetical protein